MERVTFINGDLISTAIHAMSQCYQSKSITLTSLVNACKAGHLSLLEHISITLDLEMSQKVLAQITRHRHFSFTVESSRGTNMQNNSFFTEIEDPELVDVITKQMRSCVDCYEFLLKQGVSLEQAAKILPLGMGVHLTVTGNLRCWMEYLSKRLCKRSSLEHRQLAIEIYEVLHEQYPDFINLDMLGICENCKEASCDFTVHKKSPKDPIRVELAK